MPRKKKAALFDDDKAGSPSTDISLRINSVFAASFEDRKRRQDLAKAAELGLLSAAAAAGAGDASSASSEDEGNLLDAATEAGIQTTIAAIRARDPRIYDPGAHFFSGAPAPAPGEAEAPPKRAAKGKNARELLRAQLLEAAAAGREDAFEDDDALDGARGVRRVDDGDRSANPRLYNQEQRELRAAFLRDSAGGGGGGGGGGGEEEEGADGDDTDGLFRVKPKTASQRAAEEEDARATREALLAAMRAKSGGVAAHAEELADPEGFLNSFMTSAAWRFAEREGEEDAAAEAAAATAATAVGGGGADSEEELERAENFETTYNFRFEDPSGGAIVTHARGAGAEASLRRKESKRKEERERRRERETEVRREAEKETRRLMNLKRSELKKQARTIATTAGDLAPEDLEALLEGDWDPAAHDARMAALFGDNYYGAPEREFGGEVEEEEEEGAAGEGRKKKKKIAPWVFGDGPRPAWAGPSAEELAAGVDDGLGTLEEYEGGGEEEEEEEEEKGAGGEVADPAVVGQRRASKAGRRKAKAARLAGAAARVRAALAAERGGVGRANDPDEVLALGFEDVIAGGLRTRFKYVQVKPERFGLTPEELLHADDVDLTALVSLRKLAPYREKEWHVPYTTKTKVLGAIKRKVADRVAAASKPNVAGGGAWGSVEADGGGGGGERGAGGEEERAGAEEAAGEGEGAKKKRKRRKKKKGGEEEGGEASADGGEGAAGAEEAAVAAKVAAAAAAAKEERREAKRKRRKLSEEAAAAAAAAPVTLPTGAVVSAARLKSFGF